MSGHTPEPWTVTTHTKSYKECGTIILGIGRIVPDVDYDRAYPCVNACAGMADPAAEIAAMRELVEAAEEVVRIGCDERAVDPHQLSDLSTALAKYKEIVK